MTFLVYWLLVGFGCWLGLYLPQYKRIAAKYTVLGTLLGLTLTVLFFPVALFFNRDK